MKKVAIYGAADAGEFVYKALVKFPDMYSITIWIDNNLYGKTKNGIPVISHKQFIEGLRTYDEISVLIAMKNEYNVQNAVIKLLDDGFSDIWLIHKDSFYAELPVLDTNGNYLFIEKYDHKKPLLKYIEYQVVDECNLKCKACTHFSNIVKSPAHADITEFEHSLIELKKRFYNIEEFRLLGGEPLLNDSLHEYLILVRHYFPLSDIRVVTNGLLVTHMPKKLTEVMKMYNIKIDITQYIPTSKMIKSIVQFLQEKEIGFHIGKLTKEFVVRMSYGEKDYKEVFYRTCFSGECKFLRNNRIYTCPHIPLLYEHQEYFGVYVSEEELRQSGIDLNDANAFDGWDILKKLNKPLPFCRFCSLNPRKIEWSTGRADKNDWIS